MYDTINNKNKNIVNILRADCVDSWIGSWWWEEIQSDILYFSYND